VKRIMRPTDCNGFFTVTSIEYPAVAEDCKTEKENQENE
jgi:hypothetical protein